MSKITPRAVKIYKPEILICPKCKSNLKYVHTVSNKVVQFSSGKYIRIKNLGYKCPSCNDRIYFSQTANKLSFKGYTYSAKIICMIYYYKSKGVSKYEILDLLSSKNIIISDRNIDIIYNKVKIFFENDYDTIIKKNYQDMINEFQEIRLTIDLITIEDTYFIILYNFFSSEILTIWQINNFDEELNNTIGLYLKPCYPIKVIVSIRNIGKFLPKLKKLSSPEIKYISFNKF